MQRVLVVDDEPYVREALQRVLTGSGLATTAVADAGDALAELREHEYQLAIIDVIIPQMNGVELIKGLKREFPGLAIIAMSGGGSVELSGYRPDAISTRAYLAAAEQAGADNVLAKPFETAELERAVWPLLKAVES